MAGFSGSTGVNKKYVDDAIQQSTAGANGYLKTQDGTMIQWGKTSLTRNAGQNTASVTYPYPFAAAPIAWASYETGAPNQFIASVNSVNASALTVILYNTGSTVSTSVNVCWLAIGRWK